MTNRFLKRLLILSINTFCLSVNVFGGYSGIYCRKSNFDESLILDDLESNSAEDGPNERVLDNTEDWAMFFEGKYESKVLSSVIYRQDSFQGLQIELDKLQSLALLEVNLFEKRPWILSDILEDFVMILGRLSKTTLIMNWNL